MDLCVRMKSSDKLGTYYGVFHGEFMVHYEFSRSAAVAVLDSLLSGKSLHDVLLGMVRKEILVCEKNKLESMQNQLSRQSVMISELESEVNKYKNLYECLYMKSFNVDRVFVDRLVYKYGVSFVNAVELALLIMDMKEKKFSLSGDLSNYIVEHKLGFKYKNISGILSMKQDTQEWDFEGGFSPDIYRIVCKELGLVDRGTSARVVGFRSEAESE